MFSPLVTFEKWCVNVGKTAKTLFDLANELPNSRNPLKNLSDDQKEVRRANIKNRISEAIQKSLENPIELRLNCESEEKIEIVVPAQDGKSFDPYKITEDQKCNFSALKTQLGDLIIEDAVIGELEIKNSPGASFNLKNCCIKEITIFNDRKCDLTLDNCLIGKLTLKVKSINTLNAEGGGIISILCPPPDGDNPFIGSVTLKNVYFPTKESLLFKGRQQYSNLRAHFEVLQNTQMANLMRAKELASEHENETGLTKLFLDLYALVSDYGVKPGKPLWGLLVVYILMGLIIGVYKGFWESLVLPFQAILYPVGILRKVSNFSELSIFFKFSLQILALVADGLIIFVIAGLRKRFKLH